MDVRLSGVAPSEIVALYENGALSEKEYRASIDWATKPPLRERWTYYLRDWFLIFGALLVVAGIIFFGAYNWSALHRFEKFGMLELLLLGCWLVGWLRGIDSREGQALLLVASLLVGALLAVVGQVYQSGADASSLFWVWAGLILPWSLMGRSNLLWVIDVVLFNVALVLSLGDFSTDNQMAYFSLIYAACNLVPLLVWEKQRLTRPWMSRSVTDLWLVNILGPLLFSATLSLWEGEEYLICLGLTLVLLYGLYRGAADRLSSMTIFAFSTIWLGTSLLIRLLGGLEFFGFLVVAVGLIAQIAAASSWLKTLQREQSALVKPSRSDPDAPGRVKTVLQRLSTGGFLDPQPTLEQRHDELGPPWYVSLLTGFGAWLASWFLLIFVVAFIDRSGPAMGLVGLILASGSTLLRRSGQAQSEFRRYGTLSVHLAGHLLVVAGYGLDGDWNTLSVCLLIFVSQVGTLLFYRDELARFLSALAAVVSGAFIGRELMEDGGYALWLFLVALAISSLLLGQRSWLLSRWRASHGPVVFGLSAGLLIMVCAYSIEGPYVHFGQDVPLAVGLTLLSVACAVRLQAPFSGSLALLVVGAVSHTEPGLMAGILVFLLAFQTRSRGASILSVVAILTYGTFYYYNIQVSFLLKSATLIGSGLVLLLARYSLREKAVEGAF